MMANVKSLILHELRSHSKMAPDNLGETLLDPRALPLNWKTDLQLAKIYAATICQPAAISAYLHFAAQEAKAILQTHWSAVDALAAALEGRQTLDGVTVDSIIAKAVQQDALELEWRRRQRRRDATERATIFLENCAVSKACF
jgi:hypothetical protein